MSKRSLGWRRIVVGVDGSPESLRAVEQAANIAHAARGLLFPVHAVPAVPGVTVMAGIEPLPAFSPELQRELLRSAREQIERALGATTAGRHLEVQTGPAPYVIAEEAREQRADLVVLGGKRHGALARGLGRSTAHYLVRTLDVPMLIVGESTAPIRNVLAAVDLSQATLPTIRAARRLAGLYGASVRVLHVVEPFRFTDIAPDLWDESAYRRHMEEAFEALVSAFEDVTAENRVVRQGAPVEAIVQEAGAWHADVVVVGSHGKGWVDRILVGSTTQRLVAELPASLLVVPVKEAAAGRLKLTQPRTTTREARRGLRRSRRR